MILFEAQSCEVFNVDENHYSKGSVQEKKKAESNGNNLCLPQAELVEISEIARNNRPFVMWPPV